MTKTGQRAPRVRASELSGRGWLNTGGESLNISDLRGKIVILDFWTFCCINCLHVIDELRPLEEQFDDVLVTVGVHSPKFDHEADPDALAAAVERYSIAHPVLDDPELITWQAYTARAWPTLVVIDPEGYIVANLSGEGHVAGLTSLVEELVEEHEAKGTLHRGEGPYVPPEPVSRTLRFPAKAVSADGGYLIADTGHNRILQLADDLETVTQVWGSGEKDYVDGAAQEAAFNEPQAVTALPAQIAEQVGYQLVVADTVNHRLRGINTTTGEVTTIAGNGTQRLLDPERVRTEGGPGPLQGPATSVSLSSPWDVVWSDAAEQLIVAMAGTHQIFSFDPMTGDISVYAGTGLEGLVDGAPGEAWFAQTSGMAQDAAGDIWFVDAETSALRVLRVSQNAQAPSTETIIGEGLFDFGFRDGDPTQARLQHPLGVTTLPDDSVLVADTYNGAIRRYRGAHTAPDGREVAAQVQTVARGLKEPSDVIYDADQQAVLVVETNAHQLIRIAIPEEFLTVDEGARESQRPATTIQPGDLDLSVHFSAPTGQKLDYRWGDPTQLQVSATPPELLLDGAGTSEGLQRDLVINPNIENGVVHITARAAACDGNPGEEIPLHAACHLYQQDWGIPVTLGENGENHLSLNLRGVQ